MALMETMWNAMLAPAAFCRKSPEWKNVGFQGEDPATDVRGGGALSMQCLAHFATLHTFGLKAMLKDLQDLERIGSQSGNVAGYYPVSTTSIVLCSRLCDSLGISNGMRGPISDKDLEQLLNDAPPSDLAYDLRPMLSDSRRRGGFYGIFSLMLADFHVRFTLLRASYMESQPLVEKALEVLARRLKDAQTNKRRSSVSAIKSVSYRGSRSFKRLFELYATADDESDAGPSHAKDVHNILTATEVWRATSIKKMQAAVRVVTLENSTRSARARTQSNNPAAGRPRFVSTQQRSTDVIHFADPPPDDAGRVSTATGPRAVLTLRVEAGAVRAELRSVGETRGGAASLSIATLVSAATAKREAKMSSELRTPMHLALPTSSSIKEEAHETNVHL